MTIDEIAIGSKWEDVLGKATFSKKGILLKERAKRFVLITNKTSNSVEYKDEARYISWVTFDEFIMFEKSIQKPRFIISS